MDIIEKEIRDLLKKIESKTSYTLLSLKLTPPGKTIIIISDMPIPDAFKVISDLQSSVVHLQETQWCKTHNRLKGLWPVRKSKALKLEHEWVCLDCMREKGYSVKDRTILIKTEEIK